MNVITILVASDEGIPRVALKHLLASEHGFRVVGVTSCKNVARQTAELKPNVVLIYWGEPISSELVSLVRRTASTSAIVVLDQCAHYNQIASIFAVGALGCVQIRAVPEELFTAIRAAAKGHRFIDSSLKEELLEFLAQQPASGPKALSQRERDVLRMIAYGYTLKEIANEMNISQKSVETYRVRIREKLGLRTRLEIVNYALGNGILVVPAKKAS